MNGTADFIQGYEDGYAKKDSRHPYENHRAMGTRWTDYQKGRSAGWFDRKADDYRNSTPEQRAQRLQRELDLEIEAMDLDSKPFSSKLDKATYPDDTIDALNFLRSAIGPQFPKEG